MRGSPGPRVLHVSQPVTEGVAAVVRETVRVQRAAGWDVHLACPPDSALARDAERLGASCHAWPARRAPHRGTAREVVRLQHVLRTARPDLLHLHSSKAGLVGRLAARGAVTTVLQPHAWSFWAGPRPVRAAAHRWERAAARWTHLVICCSEEERLAAVGTGVHAPLVVVPNAVDVTRFAIPAADRAAARRRLRLPDGPLAVCVGRLAAQKGQDLLLEIWPAVRERVPGADLVLVGDGPDGARLRRAAPPGATLVGRRADVPDWWAAADVALLPSRWEGMALTALETVAAGRSAVASDLASMREAMVGSAAFVARTDAAGWVDAVVQRLSPCGTSEGEEQAARARRAALDLAVWAPRLLAAVAGVAPGPHGQS